MGKELFHEIKLAFLYAIGRFLALEIFVKIEKADAFLQSISKAKTSYRHLDLMPLHDQLKHFETGMRVKLRMFCRIIPGPRVQVFNFALSMLIECVPSQFRVQPAFEKHHLENWSLLPTKCMIFSFLIKFIQE